MAKLLLVDDDSTRLQRLKRIAAKAGFLDTESCGSLSEALDLIRKWDFLMAVIDIVLTDPPEKLGLELIRMLKQVQPSCKVLALTSYGGTDLGIEALENGADDFISTMWESISWTELLEIRLKMWRGLLNSVEA